MVIIKITNPTNNDSIYIYTIYGWCYSYPSEKYEFVSWDDDIPNIYGKS